MQHFIVSPFLGSWEEEHCGFLNEEQVTEANMDRQRSGHNHQVALAAPHQDIKGELVYPQVLLYCLSLGR